MIPLSAIVAAIKANCERWSNISFKCRPTRLLLSRSFPRSVSISSRRYEKLIPPMFTDASVTALITRLVNCRASPLFRPQTIITRLSRLLSLNYGTRTRLQCIHAQHAPSRKWEAQGGAPAAVNRAVIIAGYRTYRTFTGGQNSIP